MSAALLTSSLILGSVTFADADEAQRPTPTPIAAYNAQLATYKLAMTQCKVAIVTNNISCRGAMQKYWTASQVALANFQTLNTPYPAKRAALEPRSISNAKTEVLAEKLKSILT